MGVKTTRRMLAALAMLTAALAMPGCSRPRSTMSSSVLKSDVLKTSEEIAHKAIYSVIGLNEDFLVELGLSRDKAKTAVANGPARAVNVEIKFEGDGLIGPDYFRQYDVRYSIGSTPMKRDKTMRIWLVDKEGTVLLSGIQYPEDGEMGK